MRFITYSHDSCGLGHLRRTFVLGRHLAESIPESTVLSIIGSMAGQTFFSPQSRNHDYIKLPSVQKFGAGDYRPRHWSMQIDELIGIRATLIADTLRVFAPDVVIVDKNPEGLEGELVPALEALRANSKTTRIVLGLRDILDDPSVVAREWQNPEFVSWVDSIYDDIWIWGEPEVFDAAEVYRFSEPIRKKTRYMGYLPPNPPHDSAERLRRKVGITTPEQRLALLTFGGGGDALPKILTALQGLKAANQSCLRAIVIAGPLMSDDDFSQLQKAARALSPQVSTARYVNNLDDWIRASDAVVCMGGYNTMCEVAAIGKPALVLPRTEPRLEQSLRARTFSDLGWCEYVDNSLEGVTKAADFFQRLAADKLTHSLVPLACRAFDSLDDAILNSRASVNGGGRISGAVPQSAR